VGAVVSVVGLMLSRFGDRSPTVAVL